MKTKFLSFLFIAAMIAGCTKDSPQEGTTLKLKNTENPLVTPVLYADLGPGGNVPCNALGEFEFSSDKYDYENEDFYDFFLQKGLTVTVTEDTYVTWSYTPPAGMCIVNMAVIVKGTNAANVYIYDFEVYGDTGLASPLAGNSGTPANLSNLTFCWNLVECEEEKCYEFQGETAWAGGTRYVTKGNWATYTPYAEGPVKVFAGQTIEVGTATFSAVVNGEVTITIELTGDWVLEDVDEALKIQGYDVKPPAENPAPGLFATYKGNDLTVTVPAFNFYGIHLNVGQWIEVTCPEVE
jgi:hypothetical protein